MAQKTTVRTFAEMESYVGKEFGVSDYHTVTQTQINQFADATLDHQWIHIDPARAAKESQFGSTIAHGYLTISLAPYLLSQILDLPNLKMGVNYGIDSLRFMNPVKVNAKIRLKAELLELKNLKGTARSKIKLTFEVEGEPKPVCVAEVTYLYQFNE